MLTPINAILGSLLLVAGRKLFWLFIGTLGFINGVQLASKYFNGPEWLTLVIGLIAGLVFALLAVFLQTFAIWVAGFLAGGYGLSILTGMLNIDAGKYTWIIYIIGGIIGIILVRFLFDWAIIVLSSFAGASLVLHSVFSNIGFAQLIFIILFMMGIVIQGYPLLRERGSARVRTRTRAKPDKPLS